MPKLHFSLSDSCLKMIDHSVLLRSPMGKILLYNSSWTSPQSHNSLLGCGTKSGCSRISNSPCRCSVIVIQMSMHINFDFAVLNLNISSSYNVNALSFAKNINNHGNVMVFVVRDLSNIWGIIFAAKNCNVCKEPSQTLRRSLIRIRISDINLVWKSPSSSGWRLDDCLLFIVALVRYNRGMQDNQIPSSTSRWFNSQRHWIWTTADKNTLITLINY